jgi:threonine/homoserine/homoserine lactone efflux protein
VLATCKLHGFTMELHTCSKRLRVVVIPLHTWLLFCAACAALVATPGPNVAYLVSRSVAQGRAAGFASLAGTFSGSGLHVVAAALGLSALLLGVPLAYQGVRWAGAIYLACLAWATWSSTQDTHDSNAHPVRLARGHLFRQGFLTGVLNPKVAAFQLAFFPQFLSPSRGSLLAQSLVLGATQLAIALVGDSLWILAAAGVHRWAAKRAWSPKVARRSLALVFAGLAARLALDDR